MKNTFEEFGRIRAKSGAGDNYITNINEIETDGFGPTLNIVWLYPDIMCLHGGRGDMMALLRVATLMNISVKITRVNSLREKIPFEWADLILLGSGDMKCVPDIVEALKAQMGGDAGVQPGADASADAPADSLLGFIAKGGTFLAIGSSGAALGRDYDLTDGSRHTGLEILGMDMKYRDLVYGDDVWMHVLETSSATAESPLGGVEIVGNQIMVADVTLLDGQEPFAKVKYGRGNCGDGVEGARVGNVIYTSCVGPALVKNPRLAEALLVNAIEATGAYGSGDDAGAAGSGAKTIHYDPLKDADIEVELQALEELKNFINSKI